MEFFILKDGQILGAFSEQQLEEHLRDGQLSPFDLAQTGRTPHWTPIAKLIEIELGPNDQLRSRWNARVRGWIYQARFSLESEPLRTGLFCLSVGAMLLILARWPALLCGPWFAGAAIAGCILLARGKLVPGLSLCVATLVVVVALWTILFAPWAALR